MTRPSSTGFLEQASLSAFSTFKLGGLCPELTTCSTRSELLANAQYYGDKDQPFVLLGGGSNLLISDRGIDVPVLRYVTDTPEYFFEDNLLTVDASASLDDVASFTAEQGLEGLICCSGIPGTVGGAVVGNAGAWGQQIGDVLERVEILTPSGRVKSLAPSDLNFSYRHSGLKASGGIVLSVTFALKTGDPQALAVERQKILSERASKHPDLERDPCIGSFFRNIEPTSAAGRRQAAGYFLEQAGVKDMRVGGALVFPKHANILTRQQECTAQDVYDLSRKMAAAVEKQFGLVLVREIRLLGPFEGAASVPDHCFH